MSFTEITNCRNRRSRIHRRLPAIVVALLTFILAGCNHFYHIPHYGLWWHDDHITDPGTGTYNVGVVPTAWKFNFRDTSHPIQEIRLLNTTPYFWGSVGNIDWESNVTFKDKDGDNEYNWLVQYTLFAIPHSYMSYKSSPTMRGGPTIPKTIQQSFSVQGLRGFTDATVVLTGWRFGFWGEEHSIAKIGIRLTDIAYNSEAGTITWNVQNAFADEDGDDNYYWSYQYLVIALNKTNSSSEQAVTDSPIRSEHCYNHAYTSSQWGIFDNLLDPICEPSGEGIISPLYEHGIKLPQGWYYEMPQNNYDVENSFSGTGFITCSPNGKDVHIQKIALNKDASKSFYTDWGDHHPAMAPLLLTYGIEFGPYGLFCTMGCHDPAGCNNYQQDSPRISYEVPKFDVDFVVINWDGGDVNYYPPDSWLNNGAGWHCNCEKYYDEHKWITKITPAP